MPCHVDAQTTLLPPSLTHTRNTFNTQPPLPLLPDILPLGLKAAAAANDPLSPTSSTTTIEAPYEAFPSWAALYPFLVGEKGWSIRRKRALFGLVEVGMDCEGVDQD